MEKNYSSTDRSSVVDGALSLPHFDEEATLLSARPVVPLNEVKADARSRRPLIFGLTILVAILVGAIGATLMIQRGQNSQRAAESEGTQPAVSSAGAAGGSTLESAVTRVPVGTPDEKPQLGEVPSARDSLIKKRQTAAILPNSVKPAKPDYETLKDLESDGMELRRAERRDARREARRQLRRKREQIGDDVLRIREIFEGSPRP